MSDDIFECVDPNGVPFSKTNNFVDKAWAMKKIAALEEEIARLRAIEEHRDALRDKIINPTMIRADRYWEARWRDESEAHKKLKAEHDALTTRLREENARLREVEKHAAKMAIFLLTEPLK